MIYLERDKAVLRLNIVASNSAFTGTGFPGCDFADPAQAENLIGRYTLRTTYYDAAYHQVNSADTLGRYGALVKATTEDGKAIPALCDALPHARRRTEQNMLGRGSTENKGRPAMQRAKRVASVMQAMLQELNLQQPAVQEQYKTLEELYNRTQGAFTRLPECAVFLAGLSEMAPGDALATSYTGVQARDERWWYGLRQHLGISETYPYFIQYPDGYDKTRRYPLIICLHGLLDNDVDFDLYKQTNLDAGLLAAAKSKYPLHPRHALFAAHDWSQSCWSPEKVDATLARSAGQRAGRSGSRLPDRHEYGRLRLPGSPPPPTPSAMPPWCPSPAAAIRTTRRA